MLRSIAPRDPRGGRRARLPPDGRRSGASLRGDRRVGRRLRHVPRRGDGRPGRRRRGWRASTGSGGRRRFNPRTSPDDAAAFAREARRRARALHEHRSRLLGAGVHAGGARRGSPSCASSSTCRSRSTAASAATTCRAIRAAGARLLVAGARCSATRIRRPPTGGSSSCGCAVTRLARALELAERGAGHRRYPNPIVGAVVVRGRRGRGRGVARASRRGGTREVVALAPPASARAGATLYVTLEPCSHHGSTPPCTDAIVAAGVARVVVGAARPEPRGRRAAWTPARRRGSRSRSSTRSRRAGRTRPGGPGSRDGRPVRHATRSRSTLDGRVTVPGARWVTGEESRRLVHELRAASDAVAVGMGTVRADAPRLDARDVPARAPAAPARVRARPVARRLGARAPLGARSRRARGARRRGRAVAPARRRPDARDLLPRGGPRRQAARSSSRRRCLARPARWRPASSRPASVPLTRLMRPPHESATTCCSRPTSRSRSRLRASRSTGCLTLALPRVHRDRARGRPRRVRRGRRRTARLTVDAPATAPAIEVGGSVSIDGVCLTAEAVDGRARSPSTPSRRRCAARRSAVCSAGTTSTSSLRCAPASRSAATSSRVTSTASAPCGRSRPEGEGLRVFVEARAGASLLRREGLDHRRRRLAHGRRARRRRLRGRAHAAHARRRRRSGASRPDGG